MENSHFAELRALISDFAQSVNSQRVIPRQNTVADIVLLGLVSKAFALFWAVLELAETGFSEEAFGLARTSVELRLIVRYLTNKDVDVRCKRYYDFGAKALVRSGALLETYVPHRAVFSVTPKIESLATGFRTHREWAEAKIKDFAAEPNAYEVDAQGEPTTQTATYETLYWQMSSFVHVNIGALIECHLPQAGEEFLLNKRKPRLEVGEFAVSHSARSLGLVITVVFRFLGLQVSDDLTQRFQRILLVKKGPPDDGL